MSDNNAERVSWREMEKHVADAMSAHMALNHGEPIAAVSMNVTAPTPTRAEFAREVLDKMKEVEEIGYLPWTRLENWLNEQAKEK